MTGRDDAPKSALRAGGLLLLFAAVATALLATTFDITRSEIAHNEQQTQRALIAQVMPATLHDNDLLKSVSSLAPDDLLGTRNASRAWVARKQGRATGVVLEAIAPDGYSGEIALLIGISADGRITGVRVTGHKETPGLGDYIEIAKSRWITQFDGKSLTDPAEAGWKVQRDGGHFDARAGATITPRAVVKTVNGALHYFIRHRSRLLGPSAHPAVFDNNGLNIHCFPYWSNGTEIALLAVKRLSQIQDASSAC